MSEKTPLRGAPLFSEENTPTQLRGLIDEVKMVATGGMAHIFKARQPSLDRYIVVKKLKEELLGNPEVKERFRREAKALASVLHQNIAHVYDFVEGERESFILMEHIDGVDLSFAIQKIGHLPPDVAAVVLLGLAKGVSYIHTHNLIHRDIKPSNIRLTSKGDVKLMDFGIVMEVDNHALTRPGMMVGSPSYLSPEQVLGDPISPKADLFLMGICFYEMLTGVRPFKEEGGKTVFQKIREAEYVPIREMNSSVPKALAKIVDRCLEKNPSFRYDDVKEIVTELEKFLGAEKSNHSEDVLLKFLDGEALLTPSIPYAELKSAKKAIGWPMVLTLCVVGGLILFGLGFWLGKKQSPLSTENSQNAYPPTQPVNKPQK